MESFHERGGTGSRVNIGDNYEDNEILNEGENEEEEDEEEDLEETEDDKAHQNKLKEVVDTLRSKRTMSTQRPSTIVHVNTGALEVSHILNCIFISLGDESMTVDSSSTNEKTTSET
jgi:hypothetical protein